MTQTETFDVFTKEMIRLGTASRQEVHAKGLWHQTFQCWIMKRDAAGEIYLLFQLRHKNKDVFPSLLDISCAGHLQAGEEVADGVRELEEELGLTVSIHDLTYCGRVAQEHVVSPELIDREVNHVFLYECSSSLRDFRLQAEELSGLYWIGLRPFRELLNGERDQLSACGIVLDEASGTLADDQRSWRIENFTPNSDEYYELLFAKLGER
ncbi:NUDIX hydrolase [Paenibacillus macerans]|uniref:NUDIX hydrolase n=1 Tax=Paenibacillus macerans TaxID=44252 RepID=UPI003D3205A1